MISKHVYLAKKKKKKDVTLNRNLFSQRRSVPITYQINDNPNMIFVVPCLLNKSVVNEQSRPSKLVRKGLIEGYSSR